MQNIHNDVNKMKQIINIVDVVGKVVPLKKSGASYKGIRPFYHEEHPSFVVNDKRQMFICFGCGATGDIIEFTKRYYNLDFIEACEKLSEEYGTSIDFTKYTEATKKEDYYKINREAAAFFQREFWKYEFGAQSYMKARGFDNEVLDKFMIGYANCEADSLYRYFKAKGVKTKALLELGLIRKDKSGKYYDTFVDRIIFPVVNTLDEVVGFGSQRIRGNDSAIFLNSQESPVFKKGNNLYALNETRTEIFRAGRAIIVENYMDLLTLYQMGIKNAVAVLGTSLTQNQAKILKRYTNNISLCYDMDQAGKSAASKAKKTLESQGLNVKTYFLKEMNEE